MADIETLSAGAGHILLRQLSGAAFCWGGNSNGELRKRNDQTTVHSRLQSMGAFFFVTVSAGFSHSCGVTASAAAYCWGDNEEGELGSGSDDGSRVPIPVSGRLQFSAVSAGFNHSCGADNQWCCLLLGRNEYGQLGNGGKVSSDKPVPVAWRVQV